MKPNFAILAYLLVSLLIIAFFAESLKLLVNRENSNLEVYQETTGELKYAVGVCTGDSDCAPAGCSLELCSSDASVISTCEVKNDTAPINYTCGCASNFCAWIKN